MNFLKNWLGKSNSKDIKLAIICNWNQKCGISTYTKFLVEELQKLIPDIKIFSEISPNCQDEKNIVYCWKRNESVKRLKKEIKKYDPTIIMVQHEYGIFPTVVFWYNLLSFLQDYKYVVALHSVYEHRDKFLCESPLNNVVVHTEEAAQTLLRKGYNGTFEVIPHGCPTPNEDRNWNSYGTPHTIMQYGFAFEYKNFEDSILATSMLKQKYEKIYLTCYLSESSNCKSLHEKYYKKLKDLVELLGLEENVGLIRGFLTDKQLVEALKTNKICVLPYKTKPEHDVYGSSGAAKIAMAHKIPVIVGDCHLFDDVKAAGLPSAKNAQDIANHCDDIFRDWKIKKAIIDKQIQYCKNNSWEITAQRYYGYIDRIIKNEICPYKV
jgi:glycosyltransferase involved in cell wall biosynthesis